MKSEQQQLERGYGYVSELNNLWLMPVCTKSAISPTQCTAAWARETRSKKAKRKELGLL